MYGTNTIDLADGTQLHVHFANNRGRGRDNVTLTRVAHGMTRPQYTRQYDAGMIIAQTRTSGWRGIINFSARVRAVLAIN